MSRYDDMLHRNRPPSRHPKMHRQERAKIFAPFDALTGLGKVIAEKQQAQELEYTDFFQDLWPEDDV